MENKKSYKPLAAGDRIQVLDSLRGFAIFGILIINIGVFSGYAYMPEQDRDNLLLAEWNSFFDWIHSVFFSGKFYTIFSILFGIGFAVQFMRASESGRSFILHFSRRLFFLLLFGIVHLWGIWFSDILAIYAMCGFILIIFKNFSNNGLLAAAFLIMLIPGVHSYYLQTTGSSYTNNIYENLNSGWNSLNLPNAPDKYETFQMADVAEVIKNGSWSTVLNFNYIGPLLRGYIFLLDARIFKVLSAFVLGLWTGRMITAGNLHEKNSLLTGIAVSGFLIGIPLNIFYSLQSSAGQNTFSPVLKEALTPFGYAGLAAGYIASFMLIFRTGIQKVLSGMFGAVGRTALSNYIMQSLICIPLFYGAGLGLSKFFGSALLTLSVFIIFAFQVLLSTLWLKRYKYGPLEWLWRVLTYGSHIKNKISNRFSTTVA